MDVSLEQRGTTTAGVISFAERLEERSMSFYEGLSAKFPAHADLFSGFAREDKLNKILVTRTYQETVTDALETGFSFEGLDLASMIPKEAWMDSTTLGEALATSLVLEHAAVQFYTDLASRSQGLLSTIYTAFNRIAGSRKKRVPKLESLSNGTSLA